MSRAWHRFQKNQIQEYFDTKMPRKMDKIGNHRWLPLQRWAWLCIRLEKLPYFLSTILHKVHILLEGHKIWKEIFYLVLTLLSTNAKTKWKFNIIFVALLQNLNFTRKLKTLLPIIFLHSCARIPMWYNFNIHQHVRELKKIYIFLWKIEILCFWFPNPEILFLKLW